MSNTAQASFPQRTPDRTGYKVTGAAWVPPGDRAFLERVAERLRTGLPLTAIYGDLEAVLGDHADPTPPEVDDLTQRLRGALMQLVDRVLEQADDRLELPAQDLIDRARTLRQEKLPAEYVKARVHLRRLALITQAVAALLPADSEQ